MKQLVIFDLDGTLLNTIDDLGNAANYALEKCGYPLHALSSYPFFVGNGITRLLKRVLPEDERSASNVDILRRYFKEYYDEHNTDCTKPYPGIPELLQRLNDNDVKIAVASNKYQSAVEKLMHHYFPNVKWGAIEGEKSDYPRKPDPSIVFDILSKIPTPKAATLYVGDSGVDMETARRACIESVGVTWGFRSAKELRDYHADHIVSTVDELTEIIEHPLVS